MCPTDSGISPHKPILIVGAGPAGMLLGLMLEQYEIPFQIYEKDAQTHQHSRAIGIHPVSLTIFDQLNILDDFYEAGNIIEQGAGYLGADLIGRLDFTELPFPHPRILTVPQYKTEQILKERLLERRPNSIQFNSSLENLTARKNHLEARISTDNSSRKSSNHIQGSFVVGCDGRYSTVRSELPFRWRGKAYSDRYIMGDFDRTSMDLEAAAVHIHPDGVIESFALPGEQRRWVVKTGTSARNGDSYLRRQVHARTGIDLSATHCYRNSTFGVERYLADPLVHGRTVLVGDAAHVISPIGGQGMNLGWMGAALLGKCFQQIKLGHPPQQVLSRYHRRQSNRARKASRRAAFNMQLGRSFRYRPPRRLILNAMLNTPLRGVTARLFTMYGLDRWPF